LLEEFKGEEWSKCAIKQVHKVLECHKVLEWLHEWMLQLWKQKVISSYLPWVKSKYELVEPTSSVLLTQLHPAKVVADKYPILVHGQHLSDLICLREEEKWCQEGCSCVLSSHTETLRGRTFVNMIKSGK
jgi:hypothetical protein